jgi:flagellar hook-length control protein FliK
VQQQLNALETGQMVWQGNVWPKQPMQWEVHEEAQRASGAEEQRQWVTQIRMDLPNLGTVSATLRFSSAGLSLALNADSAQTRALLSSACAQLLSSISNAGIKVQSTQVASS